MVLKSAWWNSRFRLCAC